LQYNIYDYIRDALDVFHQELLLSDTELRDLPNIILTLHMVGMILEARYIMTQTILDDIKKVFRW